jgi:hypothetical protein
VLDNGLWSDSVRLDKLKVAVVVVVAAAAAAAAAVVVVTLVIAPKISNGREQNADQKGVSFFYQRKLLKI